MQIRNKLLEIFFYAKDFIFAYNCRESWIENWTMLTYLILHFFVSDRLIMLFTNRYFLLQTFIFISFIYLIFITKLFLARAANFYWITQHRNLTVNHMFLRISHDRVAHEKSNSKRSATCIFEFQFEKSIARRSNR